MPVCGRHENLFVVFSGKITAPNGASQVSFAGYTDDGFRMYVDGQLVINWWVDQGATWSPFYYHNFTEQDRVIDVVFHYYNGGGPGVFHVGWGHSGIWTGVSSSAMSYGQGATQQQINTYNQAMEERQLAQTNYNEMLNIYNNKLSYYNQQNSILSNYIQTFNQAEQTLQASQSNLITASGNLAQAQNNYEVSILDMQEAILDAQEEYRKQLEFEENQRIAAAIAQALANQPQPQPVPDPEPTPQPNPEASQPEEPKPESSSNPDPQPQPEQNEPDSPNPETNDQTDGESSVTPNPEPEQSPEPQPKPTPQQTDKDPLPTPSPQPETTPAAPSPKPSQPNNTTEDLTNIIANLTSKDNIVAKLTPEQMQAVGNTLASLSKEAKIEVAQSLGVKTDDIALLAEAAKDNPAVAAAIVSFNEKAEENADAPMPYTIADAITEAAAELFLQDPLAVFSGIDLEELSDPSQWGKDMTDDQREKAQEVIVPVILVSNIVASVASALTRRL